jgi:ADP-heptose:LPS heptosyltransferase
MRKATEPRRIIVFRQGSIGDFVVSLPSFHLIRQSYPAAEIILLTNLPASESVMPAEAILDGTGLVDRYLKYPGGTRDPAELRELKAQLRAGPGDMLIYLAGAKGTLTTFRDYLFFRWCGLRAIVGISANPQWMQSRPPMSGGDLWEPEAERLARQLARLGRVDCGLARNWDLHLSDAETAEATRLLDEGLPRLRAGRPPLLGLSVGTKEPAVKDWGDDNWLTVIRGLQRLGCGLVLLGGMEDRDRSARLTADWPGDVVNLCGRSSPRVSAAVLRHVRLLLCHDSGPMHLAAAVGTPCVAIFARHSLPGRWFPFGAEHKILYPMAKSGTIRSIGPRQVIAAAVEALAERRAAA